MRFYPKLAAIGCLLLAVLPAQASHIVGGEINYRCLGGTQYEITLTVFRDCYTGIPPFDNPAAVGVFNVNNNLVQTLYLNHGAVTQVPPTINQIDQCVKIPTDICIEVTTYKGTVNLPNITGGYQLVYQRCCRNPTIVNVNNPGNVGATYYATIPSRTVVTCNSNPTINQWPPVFVCAGMELSFDHSATDPDGDSLVYSLCTPLNSPSGTPMPQPPFTPPYSPITFKPPFTQNNPMGGTLTIDANGLLKGTPTNVGQYVVGVCVSEYRNGVFLSTTRRDFQFNVLSCQKDVVTAIGNYSTNCLNSSATFTNSSVGAISYLWDFGDLANDPNDTSTVSNPTYSYPGPGTYMVNLIGYSGTSNFCNDTLKDFPVVIDSCYKCGLNLAKADATVCDEYCDTVFTNCGSVQFDNSSHEAGASPGSAWTLSWEHTVGPAPNRLLIVGITYSGNTGPSAVTYDGNALTQASTSSISPTAAVQWWYLKNPATGTADIEVSCANKTTNAAGGAVSYSCVNLSGGSPFFNTVSWYGTGGSASVTVTTVSNRDLVVDLMATNAGTVTGPGAGQTMRWNDNQGSIWGWFSDEPATGGNVTMDYTGNLAGVNWIKLSAYIRNSNTGLDTAITCTGGGAGDGTADLTVIGGSAPYNYAWDNGATTEDITGLMPGVYKVTVDDGSTCQDTSSIVIDGNSVLSLSTSMTPAACGSANGTATVTVTGGTGTYLWNNGQTTQTATGLAPGTYVVQVMDTVACFRSDTITVTEGTVIALTPSSTNLACYRDSTGMVSVSPNNGTGPFTYSWSPGGHTSQTVTGLLAGTYTVTVDDNSMCSGTRTITITQPNDLAVADTPTTVLCYADRGDIALTVTGGTPGYTYVWDDSTAQTTASATGLFQGNYNVTVTDLNGCTFELATALPGPFPLVPEILDSSTIDCIGNFNGIANSYASGGTSPFTYLWTDGQTTATATGLTPGVHHVTITDANACVAEDSITITDPGVLTLTVDASALVCNGDSDAYATVVPSGGIPPYTYLWCNGETTQNISDLKAQSCNVTVTDDNGCSQVIPANIIEPGPLAGNPSVSNVSCNGGNDGTITLSTSGGTSPFFYQWDDPSSQTSASITGLILGTYHVTITDTNGCVGFDTASITQPTVLSISTGKNNSSCGQPDGDATVTASGGTPGYVYVWDDDSTQTTATATGLRAGTYNVTVTDSLGCTQTSSVNISDQLAPSTTMSGVDLLCFADSNGTATVTPSGGQTPYSYVWGDGQTTATATGLSGGNHLVTVTDGNGCISTNNQVLTEPTILTHTTSGNDETCTSANGNISITAGGGTPGYTYVWDDANSSGTASVTGLPAGTYHVTMTDLNGCQVLDSVTIADQPSPVLSVTGTDAACNGDSSGWASVTVVGGTAPFTYLWDDVTAQTTDTAVGLNAGTYVIIMTDVNGCADTDSVAINQPTLITATADSTEALCGTSTGTATVNVAGGTPGYTYVWSDAGSQDSVTATGLSSGLYTVTVTDANGCVLIRTVNVPSAPSTTATATGTDLSCFESDDGEAICIPAGGTPPFTYIWSDGQTTNPATGLAAGVYTVTVSDQYGCDTTAIVALTQPTVLDIQLGSDTGGCDNLTFTIGGLATGGTPGYSYLWNDNAGSTTSSITVLNTSTMTYVITVTDTNGCEATDDVMLSSSPLPMPNFSMTQEPTCDGLKIKFNNLTANGSNYYWDFGDGTTSSNPSPTHLFDYNTLPNIKLVVVNGDCRDSIMVTDTIGEWHTYQNFTIPSVFTPNGDGINDYFEIQTDGDLTRCTFMKMIMNRWGVVIYQPDYGRLSWDGTTVAGVPVPSGTYFYLVQIKDKEYSGYVQLIRDEK